MEMQPRKRIPEILLISACCTLCTISMPAAENDELMDGASGRIEVHRKSDARITVVSSSGEIVSGADVQIEQTSHAFLFGSNIFLWGRSGNDEDDAIYRSTFCRCLQLCHAWVLLAFLRASARPTGPRSRPSRLRRWCKEHHIATKGHPLAWNFADPRWLPDDLSEIRKLQMARIDDCVGRFKGLIDHWDCVNEATDILNAPNSSGERQIDLHVGRRRTHRICPGVFPTCA